MWIDTRSTPVVLISSQAAAFGYFRTKINKIFNNKNIKNVNYNGVSINTKTIKKNDLFLAFSQCQVYISYFNNLF